METTYRVWPGNQAQAPTLDRITLVNPCFPRFLIVFDLTWRMQSGLEKKPMRLLILITLGATLCKLQRSFQCQSTPHGRHKVWAGPRISKISVGTATLSWPTSRSVDAVFTIFSIPSSYHLSFELLIPVWCRENGVTVVFRNDLARVYLNKADSIDVDFVLER